MEEDLKAKLSSKTLRLPDSPSGPDSSKVIEEPSREDLGDDLLEKTRSVQLGFDPRASSSRTSDISHDSDVPREDSVDINDLLQSARILINEGLLEEAKKILRKILITDNSCLVARQLLDQVHETELKQIFGDFRRRRPFHSPAEEEQAPSTLVAEDVIRELDHDLRLGLSDPDNPTAVYSSAEEDSFPLFSDPDAIRAYGERLDETLASASAQEHLDLGIAFLEMELLELAVGQFSAASSKARQALDRQGILVASALWAQALIQGGRAFDSMLLLHPILRDTEVDPDDKLEFVYLMGRAYEVLKRPEVAVKWYEEVRKFDPGYRDVDTRLNGIHGTMKARRE